MEGLGNAFEPLIGEKASENLKKNGYYSQTYPQKNLKILSLFSPPYDSLNFYNLFKTWDPLG
jgi:hypothetical protein